MNNQYFKLRLGVVILLPLILLYCVGCSMHNQVEPVKSQSRYPIPTELPGTNTQTSEESENYMYSEVETAQFRKLRELWENELIDLEKITAEMICFEENADPFVVDYLISSGSISIIDDKSQKATENIDTDALLATIRQIHNNPVFEEEFERFVMFTPHRTGFPSSLLCGFTTSAMKMPDGSTYVFELLYSPDGAPSEIEYYKIEKLDENWFILEEIYGE